MNKLFDQIKELCGNKEIKISYRYTRDGGHGDIVNEIFIMLTYDGENPYYINNGELIKEEFGIECALLYCDTTLDDILLDFYKLLKTNLNK